MKVLTPALVTLLMFVVVGGLVVAYVAKSMFAREVVETPIQTRLLPMAVTDIEPGTLVLDEHLGEGPYPTDKLERDVLTSSRVIVGRVARTKITAASPIHAAELYQPGEYPDLELEPGMRAVSVEVGTSTAMVDGLIKPNQFVDVHFTVDGSGDERRGGGLTMRLLEGIRIVAINRQITQGNVDRSSNRVTLEVTEEQANIIILAREKGTLTLSYNPEGRGHGGVAVNDNERATLEQILGLAPIEKPGPPFTTEVYSSGARKVNEFRNGRFTDNFPEANEQEVERDSPDEFRSNGAADDREAARQTPASRNTRSAGLAFPPVR